MIERVQRRVLPVRPPGTVARTARPIGEASDPLVGVIDPPMPRGALPVRPPDLPWSNRSDLARHAQSPLGACGWAVHPWCDPEFEGSRLAGLVDDGLGILDGATRLDDPHTGHAGWIGRVLGPAALALPRAVLGNDLAIESSRLLVLRPGAVAGVPVHQCGHGPGLLLDPRRMLTMVCLFAHDDMSGVPWARVAEYTPADGYMRHDYAGDAGSLGRLPRLRRENDGPRWCRSQPIVRPGDVLHVDGRTLLTYGTSAPWMALVIRLIAPGAVVARPTHAPRVRRVSGSATRWGAASRELASALREELSRGGS